MKNPKGKQKIQNDVPQKSKLEKKQNFFEELGQEEEFRKAFTQPKQPNKQNQSEQKNPFIK